MGIFGHWNSGTKWVSNETPNVFEGVQNILINLWGVFKPPVKFSKNALVLKLLGLIIDGELGTPDICKGLYINDKKYFRNSHLHPALEQGLIELTIPDKPQSSRQKYRLTDLGHQYLARNL